MFFYPCSCIVALTALDGSCLRQSYYMTNVYCRSEWRHRFPCVCMLSCVQLFAIPWTVAHQAPLSLGFPRQEYWSGLPFPSPGDLPWPRDRTRVSYIAGEFFTNWTTRLRNANLTTRTCIFHLSCWQISKSLTMLYDYGAMGKQELPYVADRKIWDQMENSLWGK